MLTTLFVVIAAMLFALFILSKVLKFHRNIAVLFFCMPMLICISPTITFVGGLLASKIAPDPSLATLPLTILIIGIATSTFLVAGLSRKYGRKMATNLGFVLALTGTLLAMYAAIIAHFYLLLVAAFLLGGSLAFAQQMRFAAIESVNKEQAAKVLSALMLSGIFAAMIGPEIAFLGKDWIDSPHGYAGSFLALALVVILSWLVFQLFSNPQMSEDNVNESQVRPLTVIIKQPIFIIALFSAAIGYGLMSFIMTATPLSMHEMNGHSLADTKWVIQSHIAAMFLPSLFTGILIKRFHSANVLLVGTLMFAVVAVIALTGQQVVHYWWALVLLGIGWNFLFITGTVLLPESYHAGERFKVQAVNDFAIFVVQGFASLLAGWILFKSSWNVLMYSSMPFIAIMLVVCIWHYRNRSQSH
ncbi:MFS transporter [Thalassotalea sp. ND16A]|uniref:MFS transporter n=1 Tax=Thalassotalea sp. ND16A TaxID=1535422 RepID=UPI00051D3900|nr:MFS transporter [Thalassotalea sp. ND16A]KGK00483.1 hypothetical protein ND16A_3451 [Thalassotalea sp. ND16A]